MSLHQRLARLEQLHAPAGLTAAERLRRINDLLAYRGADPDTLARQARLLELYRQFRRETGQP